MDEINIRSKTHLSHRGDDNNQASKKTLQEGPKNHQL